MGRRLAGVALGALVGVPVLWGASVLRARAFRPLNAAASEPGVHTLSGAVHVHTTASDGGGSVEDVVAAAVEVGLDFVVLTEHNTTSVASWEGEHDGVLVLVGVECTLRGEGHALFLGLSPSLPAEESGRSLFDALSQSRVAFAAHPTSPKRPWSGPEAVPAGGLELFSADTSWRNRSVFHLGAAAAALPFERHGAFASLVREPSDEIALWQSVPRSGPAAIVGSVNAHARIGLGEGRSWRFPEYEDLFRLVTTRVRVGSAWPTSPMGRIAALRAALESGAGEVCLNAFGSPPDLRFAGVRADGRAVFPGASVPRDEVAELWAEVGPSGIPVRLELYRGEELFVEVTPPMAPRIRIVDPEPGRWRVEVHQVRGGWNPLAPRSVPWVYTNEVWVSG